MTKKRKRPTMQKPSSCRFTSTYCEKTGGHPSDIPARISQTFSEATNGNAPAIIQAKEIISSL